MRYKASCFFLFALSITLLLTACTSGTKKPLETQTAAPEGQKQELELAQIDDIALGDVPVDTDNPIDQAFAGQYDTSLPTPVLNLVAEEYLNAWQAEFDHIIEACETVFDPDNVALRRAQYEEAAALAQTEAIQNWSNDLGNTGTGASSAGMMAKAGTFKQAVYYLKEQYDSHAADLYIYVYSGSGVDLSPYLEESVPEQAGVLTEDEVIALLKTEVIDAASPGVIPSVMFEGEEEIDGIPCFVMSVGLDETDKTRVTNRYGVELHGALIYELPLDGNTGSIVWENADMTIT